MKLSLTLLSLFFISSNSWHTPLQVTQQSLLWEISRKDLPGSSFLLGTMHLIPKKDFKYSTKLDSILNISEEVIFEIDLNEMEDFNALLQVMMQSLMPDTNLQSLVSVEEYELIKNYFSNKGLPLYVLDRLKPMFLYVLAEGSSYNLQENAVSYEMELYQKALVKNIKTSGLETMVFQMSIFDSIPYKDQAQMLIKSIQIAENQPNPLQDIIELYNKGAVEELYQLIAEEDEIITRIMIHQRNLNWIQKMREKMKINRGLYAVGAGHLGGPTGLIQLLENNGYQVRPLPLH
ncbi:MAG: hypothetical protein RLZZ248_629 [Bacteroidota bacterium]|jgi:uncharacterized protein YbaP (TraB family)